MKEHLIRTNFFCIFCVLAMKVYSMEMNFKGTADEVESQLYSVFPLGTEREEIISIAKSKFDLDQSELQSHDYGRDPLVLEHNGQELYVYSWVKMDVAEYRSIKRMFVKTTVTAKLFFDKDEKLNGIDVTLYGDSL